MKKLILISMAALSSNVAMAAPLEFNKFFAVKTMTCKSDQTPTPELTMDVYSGGDGLLFQERMSFGEPAYLLIFSGKEVPSTAMAAREEKTGDKSKMILVTLDGRKFEITDPMSNKPSSRVTLESGIELHCSLVLGH